MRTDKRQSPRLHQDINLYVLASLLTVLMVVFGCGKTSVPSPETPVAIVAETPFQTEISEGDQLLSAQETSAFVGDQNCGTCHTSIYEGYTTTRHANTLKPVSIQEHAAIFRKGSKITDPVLGYTYRAAVDGGKCVIIGENKVQRGALPADFVMGTGRNALTFFSVENPDSWVDMRLSYYPGVKEWNFTPMQKPGDRQFTRAAGIMQTGPMLRACLKCHVTYLRGGEQGIDIKKSHIGIGCERCHGPGKAHVETFEKPTPADGRWILQMENFHNATPERINQLCGTCHHNEDNSKAGTFKTENGLARFQGVALARSRCFTESKTLSCITCHSPHQDKDPDLKKNDAICLQCHSTAQIASSPAPASNGKLCPVNPRSGCTDCHMPKQKIATIPHAQYRNHWIKVWSSRPSNPK